MLTDEVVKEIIHGSDPNALPNTNIEEAEPSPAHYHYPE